MYIDLGGSQAHRRDGEEGELVQDIIATETTLDEKLGQSQLRLFSSSKPLSSEEHKQQQDRDRRAVPAKDSEKQEEEDGEANSDAPPPTKKRKKKSSNTSEDSLLSKKNKELMKEMGEDVEDSSNEEEEENSDEDSENDFRSATENGDKMKPSDLNSRLVTGKDKNVLNKVSHLLSNIKEKEDESEMSEDDEEDLSDASDEQESSEETDLEEDEEDEFEEEIDSVQWKADLAMKARDSFYTRQSGTASLRRLVYGAASEEEREGEQEGEGDTVGGLFTVVRTKQQNSRRELDGLDCSAWRAEHCHDWSHQEMKARIADCFVTGQWAKGQDAEELIKLDDEDEEVYGDFEDLETGEKVSGKEAEGDEDEEDKPRMVDLGGEREAELAKRKERMERKLKLKRTFDTEYDGADGEKASFYEDLKKEVDQQSSLNRSEFEGLEDSVRVQYEGYRPGMYIRLELAGVPCELLQHFHPASPILLGGLLKGEDQLGFVQLRLKKHRWYPKILKNRDPLIVSLGWRRFQTIPVFSICDHNMRHRMLKYTPEHLHCDAHVWGPVTPQGTGMLAVQSVSDKQENFKIVATGVVLEQNKTTQIVKKLKLTGEPFKVFKKTAFIKGMFNSSLEVAKFEKAAIRTVSGVRGMIKKNLSEPEGAFRATFEDKILMSDIVFLKTWFNVEVPKFFTTVTNLLKPFEERSSWKGMRTVGEIKRERNIKNEVNDDNLYKAVKREPKVFNNLQIPRKLQSELPYNMKPKIVSKGTDPTKDRVAVVLDHKERKVANAFKMLKEIYGQKQETLSKEKKKRVEDFIQKKNLLEEKKLRKQKEARKQISRMVSKNQAAQERKMNRKGGGKSK